METMRTVYDHSGVLIGTAGAAGIVHDHSGVRRGTATAAGDVVTDWAYGSAGSAPLNSRSPTDRTDQHRRMTMSTSGAVVGPDRTVLDRLLQSGITEGRALDHLKGGWVRVDGQKVQDPAYPATPPSQVELKVIIRSAS